MTRRRARRALACLATVALAGVAGAWTPADFATYCGRPAYEASDDFAQTRAAWYAAQQADPDTVEPAGCAALEQRGWLEDALRDALRRLSGEPFPVSPTPTRLGPVVTRPNGAPAVRAYLSDFGGVANTFACGGDVLDGLGLLRFDGDRLGQLSLVSVPYVAAHELVHVLQQAQPFQRTLPCTVAGRLPLWVTEGTADAFATLWVRERFPSFQPPTATGLGRNLLGLRDFSVALAAPDGGNARTQLYSYRSSALFRFVAERWHGGDMGIWAAAMAQPAPKGNDGLAWLDQRLRGAEMGVGQPLALVFPSFLASYAGWGRSDSTRWPHAGEATWRRFALGACERVTLSPSAPAVRLDLALEPISGRCVEVTVQGVPANRVASVEVAVRSADLDDVDQVHLAGVSMGLPPIDGGPATCVEAERLAPPSLPACVAKATTHRRTDAAGGVTWARTFAAAQVRTTGADWTDVLVVARVPDQPNDAKDANRDTRVAPLTFVLQTAQATVDGQDPGPVQGAANLQAPGQNGLASLPGEAPGPGELDFSRLMFGQQGSLGAASVAAEIAPGAGIFVVQLQEGDGQDDGAPRGFAWTLTEGGIPTYGQGTYAAALSGSDPDRGGMGAIILDASGDEPTATVTVLAWDADRVHLAVRGTWCYADEMRGEAQGGGCARTREVAGEVWLPFGDGYDVDHPYEGVDTPVTALYREAFARAIGFAVPGLPVPATPAAPPTVPAPVAPPSAPPGALGGDAGGCDCSCDALAEIERLTASIAPGSPPPSALLGQMQCLVTCAPAFAACAP